jgi:kynurenine formamidase
MIVLGTHVGTHIDAFSHFSLHGRLHNGLTTEQASVDRIAPIVRRGLLFDAAPGGLLEEDDAITAAQLARLDVRPGDVVLIRTGWARLWANPPAYLNGQRQPGLALDAIGWLADRGVFAIGSDNVALERIPSPGMPGHVQLLVERGIHIIECMDLEELAASGAGQFVFVAAPLKLVGATGSPVRPFAIVEK